MASINQITLSTGREITFDFNKVTHRDWRNFIEAIQGGKVNDQTSYEMMGKVTGVNPQEIDDMGQLDWFIFKERFWKLAFNPIEADPKNSQSAST